MGRPKKETVVKQTEKTTVKPDQKIKIVSDNITETVVNDVIADTTISDIIVDTVINDTKTEIDETSAVILQHTCTEETEHTCKVSVPTEKDNMTHRLESEYPVHPPVEKTYNITTSSAPF